MFKILKKRPYLWLFPATVAFAVLWSGWRREGAFSLSLAREAALWSCGAVCLGLAARAAETTLERFQPDSTKREILSDKIMLGIVAMTVLGTVAFIAVDFWFLRRT